MSEPTRETAPEPRCSECNRRYIDQPCGFVHAVVQMQIAFLRSALPRLLGGDRRV